MIDQVNDTGFVHRIDSNGRISFVNEAWIAFAAKNGYQTTRSAQLGRPLLSVIGGHENRHIYGLLIDRARATRKPITFGYRCDSPAERRWMQMRMRYRPDDGEVEFDSLMLKRERRAPVRLLEIQCDDSRSGDLLSMCSWCKTVRAGDSWIEVEQAVTRLGLFAIDKIPRISHGICPGCRTRLSSLETTS